MSCVFNQGSRRPAISQELAAREFEQLPVYKVVGDGPDHAKSFTAEVIIGGELRGFGVGRSKKLAEQAAAKVAWEQLRLRP